MNADRFRESKTYKTENGLFSFIRLFYILSRKTGQLAMLYVRDILIYLENSSINNSISNQQILYT